MDYPLISVLIPTYNVASYVEEAVRSIMGQTYLNLEIIVVDDGSTDDTWSILEKLALSDTRIRVFKNSANVRIVETLNSAFAKSTGALIARMDGDDISLPDRIMKQYEFLVQHPGVSLVGLNVVMIDESSREIHKETYLTDFEKIKEVLPFASPVPHFWLCRRELYEKLGLYRIPSAEDYDFILRAIDLGYEINNIPDFLYLQRIRRGNTATALGLLQQKSITYVRKLHLERKNSGRSGDSFSVENLQRALRSSWIGNKQYQLSSKFHFKYIDTKNKSKIKSLIWLSIAIAISPAYQLRAISNRRMYKRIKRTEQSPGQNI